MGSRHVILCPLPCSCYVLVHVLSCRVEMLYGRYDLGLTKFNLLYIPQIFDLPRHQSTLNAKGWQMPAVHHTPEGVTSLHFTHNHFTH